MISSRSASLLLFSAMLLSAQEKVLPLGETEADKEEERENNQDVRSRIPAGAVLSNFSSPKFDEDLKLTSRLTAREMTVTTADLLTGKDLQIQLFNKEEAPTTTASIAEAEYLLKEERLIGSREMVIRSNDDRLVSRGTGGIFDIATLQAIVFGPSQTALISPTNSQEEEKPKTEPTTQMNFRKSLPLLTATPVLALAQPPEKITPEELADFERAVAPKIIPSSGYRAATAKSAKLNSATTDRMKKFLFGVGQEDIYINSPAAIADPDEAFENLFKATPENIVIESSKGFYLDAKNYELVYLGDIRVVGQGMTLSCNQDVKVLFHPAEEEGDREKTDKEPSALGQLKMLTASGNIRVSGAIGGEKFYLGGDRAVYDQDTGKLTLRGDNLGMKRGSLALKATHKNAYIVVTFENNELISVIPSPKDWVTVITQEPKKR